jgi:hypothetical protein
MVIRRERGKCQRTYRIRPPAVAGLFYPRDPAEILELLGRGAPPSKVMPKALIAPHAGYVYSGRVAGAAFAKLRANAQTITRIVLIGPAHYVHLVGIAAPMVNAFETLLGQLPVDTETCSQLGSFEFVTRPTPRTGPSTLWRWNCRSYRPSCHPSRWCRSLSVTRLRRRSPNYCANCGMDGRR